MNPGAKFVYLAGPITGLTFDDASDWREQLPKAAYWPEHWHALSPMRGKEKWRIEGPLPSTFDDGPVAVRRDLSDIRRSWAVIFNLAGTRTASIGTMCELGYAKGWHATPSLAAPWRIVVLDGDENPHDHLFVHELARAVVPSLKEAVEHLKAIERVEQQTLRTVA